jgi:AhpD family alkylhydroperoxidase
MGTMDTTRTKTQVHQEMTDTLGRVPEWMKQLPDASVSPFWRMFHDYYLAETKIPAKYKELIGLAVSGATRCRYCVLFHTEAARLHGATDEEIAEASMMGSFTMMASTFLNAQQVDYAQFKKETLEIIGFVRSHNGGGARREQHARV